MRNFGVEVWCFYSSFSLFICCLISGLFEVIFYHLHHSLHSVLQSLQPKGNTDKSER